MVTDFSLSDVVEIVRDATKNAESISLSTSPIEDAAIPVITAIDGGSLLMWSNGTYSIGIIRYGMIAYDESFSIVDLQIKSSFVGGNEKDIERARHIQEVSLIKKASEVSQLVLFDGALSPSPWGGIEDILKDTDAYVAGVVKKSILSNISPPFPDTDIDIPSRSYYIHKKEVQDSMKKSRQLSRHATSCLARMHSLGTTSRIDIKGDIGAVLGMMTPYCGYILCPGYPFPLEEIHKVVCLDDKREPYDAILREEMSSKGLLKTYFDGKIERDMESGELHSQLNTLI